MKTYFAFLLLLNNFISITVAQNKIEQVKKSIVGKWVSSDMFVDLTYSSDMGYMIKRNFLPVLKCPYQINVVNDSIFINFNCKDMKIKNIIFINQDELIQANYKIGKDIENHIDEVGVFYRENVKIDSLLNKNEDDIKTNYFLPPNFRGVLFFAYNQPNTNLLGTERMMDIPQSGLLKLTNETNICDFIKRRVRFYYKDSMQISNNTHQNIPLLERNIFYSVDELNKYKKDDIFVLPLGYNQLDRESINKIFGEPINGNVEMYEVNYFKNLIKYLDH